MTYLSVKNFDRFQHYKDRSPPWIKLYRDVLSDYDFTRLPDASKSHLMLIWLLASSMDNRLPNDADWLTKAIHATETVNITVLVSAGFLVLCGDASAPLAERQQHARLEEGEVEGETEQSSPSSPHAKDVFPEVVAALTTEDDPTLLDDLLARIGDRSDAHRAYLAECNAALAGLRGEMLSADELRVAARDFVTNRATPNMKLFRGYLRNAKRRKPVEVGTPRTNGNGRPHTGTGEKSYQNARKALGLA